jgi:hypothetical protein
VFRTLGVNVQMISQGASKVGGVLLIFCCCYLFHCAGVD